MKPLIARRELAPPPPNGWQAHTWRRPLTSPALERALLAWIASNDDGWRTPCRVAKGMMLAHRRHVVTNQVDRAFCEIGGQDRPVYRFRRVERDERWAA